jgi:hypothetical protein
LQSDYDTLKETYLDYKTSHVPDTDPFLEWLNSRINSNDCGVFERTALCFAREKYLELKGG